MKRGISGDENGQHVPHYIMQLCKRMAGWP